MCACVCMRLNACVFVCVCVLEGEREREIEIVESARLIAINFKQKGVRGCVRVRVCKERVREREIEREREVGIKFCLPNCI